MRASVLLIDDDENLRAAMEAGLTANGYAVQAANGGNPALKLMESAEFDVVVTDIVMADGEGFETLQAIKQRCDIAMVAISGNPQYFPLMHQLGARTLMKPLRLAELVETIDAAMG
ncbi:MAG: response regulator [Pseudomonadota bacterium]